MEIKVDGDQDGRIQLVLHELIHVVSDEALDIQDKIDDELEEAIAEAWAKELWEYVGDDSRRLKWWRTNIENKL